MSFPSIPDLIPESTHGIARVEHFTLTAAQAALESMRAHIPTSPARYAKLVLGDHQVMMSDTKWERVSNYDVLHNARGNVLIAGLGLGMILVPIMAKPEVRSVTVIEKYDDVHRLISPHLALLPGAEKLSTVIDDVFDWRPERGTKYDTIYFDIWPTISTDNLEEMTRLHRSFGRFKAPDAWMDSWMCGILRQTRRSGR